MSQPIIPTQLPSSGTSQTGGEWTIPQSSRLKYTQLFNQHDRTRSGFLSGLQCRDILLPSGLPQQTLAQIWNLSDIDNDGQLTREEFLLAMYLTDSVKSGTPLPTTLPPDLIPPSYRRSRTMSSSSVQSVGSASSVNTCDDSASVESSESSRATAYSFENKRRENYEKGQAELERRRLQLLDQQRREQEARQRKEREEAERREKLRLESERKRLEELERQQEKIRQIEAEREERVRVEKEKREAARREMERQRQDELDKLRQQELLVQSQRAVEMISQLKAQKNSVADDMERVSSECATLKESLNTSRNQVNEAKAKIDNMRSARDNKLGMITSLRAQLKTVQDKQAYLDKEEAGLLAIAKDLNIISQDASSAWSKQQAELDKVAIEAKRGTIEQMKTKIQELAEEKQQKATSLENCKKQVSETVAQLKELTEAANESYKIYQETLERARILREQYVAQNKSQMSDPNAFWAETPGADDPWLSSVATVVEASGYDQTSQDSRQQQQSQQPQQSTAAASSTSASIDQSFDDAFERLALSPGNDVTASPVAEYCVSLYPFSQTEPYDLAFEIDEYIKITKKEGDWWTGEIVGQPERQGMFPSNYTRVVDANELPSGSSVAKTTEDPKKSNIPDSWGASDDNETERQQQQKDTPLQQQHEFGETDLKQKPLQRMSSMGSMKSKKSRQKKAEVATAVASYRALGPEQMNLEKGQLVVIRRKMDSGWWEGEIQLKGKKKQYGWFPASYVKLLAQQPEQQKDGQLGSESDESQQPSTQDVRSEDLEKVVALYKFAAQHDDELSFEPGDVILVLSRNDDPTWWKGKLTRTGEVGLFPSNHVEQQTGDTSQGKGLEHQV